LPDCVACVAMQWCCWYRQWHSLGQQSFVWLSICRNTAWTRRNCLNSEFSCTWTRKCCDELCQCWQCMWYHHCCDSLDCPGDVTRASHTTTALSRSLKISSQQRPKSLDQEVTVLNLDIPNVIINGVCLYFCFLFFCLAR